MPDNQESSPGRRRLPIPPNFGVPFRHPDKSAPGVPQHNPPKSDSLKQQYYPRYNSSDRSLFSSSSPTGPSILDSTPSPGTLRQRGIPPIGLTQSSSRDSPQNPSISHTDNFVQNDTTPFSRVQRKSGISRTDESVSIVCRDCAWFL